MLVVPQLAGGVLAPGVGLSGSSRGSAQSTHNRRNSLQSSREVRREGAGGNRCSCSDLFLDRPCPIAKTATTICRDCGHRQRQGASLKAPANSSKTISRGAFSHSLVAGIMNVLPVQPEEIATVSYSYALCSTAGFMLCIGRWTTMAAASVAH
jgi:hypothetical protein